MEEELLLPLAIKNVSDPKNLKEEQKDADNLGNNFGSMAEMMIIDQGN